MIRDRRNVSSFLTKDGSRIWELYHPSSSPVNGFSVAESLVEPGQATEAHWHGEAQEVYYILEGSGIMRLGEDSLEVAAGNAILIEPGTVHAIKNTGRGALRVLCICRPPYSHEDTILA